MKPVQIFVFTWVLFIILGFIGIIYPKDGIKINDDLSLDFPSIHSLFELDTTAKVDFTSILVEDFDIDSIDQNTLKKQKKADSAVTAHIRDSIRRWQLQIHYPENDKSILFPFFKSLETANQSKTPVRIMHYGDSQIEGDRISGYLRHKLQNKFGGNGPGLVPAVPLVRSAGFDLEASKNWKRYTLYGMVDTLVRHTKYGPLATFGRYTPLATDSTFAPDSLTTAYLTYKSSSFTYPKTKTFSRYNIQFGNFTTDLALTVKLADSVILEKKFKPSSDLQQVSGLLKNQTKEITFEFSSFDSPDVYAVNLEGAGGVSVDNIALRGSSGTVFRKLDRALFRNSLKSLDTRLFLLQFGGNVMPYMDDVKEAKQYGRWFESQLILLKELMPQASIIVIGPSDMGVYENSTYTSYPLLPVVRDELKAATFRQGGAYWDMMEAMGGQNSMEAWVNANPSLASKDYIHFNLKGASKVAQMFYNALIEDYNEYQNRNEK